MGNCPRNSPLPRPRKTENNILVYNVLPPVFVSLDCD